MSGKSGGTSQRALVLPLPFQAKEMERVAFARACASTRGAPALVRLVRGVLLNVLQRSFVECGPVCLVLLCQVAADGVVQLRVVDDAHELGEHWRSGDGGDG